MKYLITGKKGQLAQAFLRELEARGAEFLAPDEASLDITDPLAVAGAVDSFKPGIIINCAAYNLVDKAEGDREKAFSVNAEGPKVLAAAARKQGAVLVHFGSDYVFDGTKENGLYTEQDAPNPLNQYGRSKLAGERFVLEASEENLVFRLSWVFGSGTQNFIHKLGEWSKSQPFLKIACDEFSVPTFTGTAVDGTLAALDQGLSGLFHLTNSGYCSRYEWARHVLAVLKIDQFIRPVSMDSFHLPAARPKFSAMSNERLSSALGTALPRWQDGVEQFLLERH